MQAVYQNICEYDDGLVAKAREDSHMLAEEAIDETLFAEVLSEVLKNWSDWEQQFAKCLKTEQKISRCAQAIMRAAFAELALKKSPEKIVINEYVELAKIFCENESGLVNKAMDVFCKMLVYIEGSV